VNKSLNFATLGLGAGLAAQQSKANAHKALPREKGNLTVSMLSLQRSVDLEGLNQFALFSMQTKRPILNH